MLRHALPRPSASMGTTALAALVCLICLLASAAAQTQPPPGAPNLLTVQFIIRDVVGQGSTGVNKTTHPDFERANAAETGMVAYRLGADRVRSSLFSLLLGAA